MARKKSHGLLRSESPFLLANPHGALQKRLMNAPSDLSLPQEDFRYWDGKTLQDVVDLLEHAKGYSSSGPWNLS